MSGGRNGNKRPLLSFLQQKTWVSRVTNKIKFGKQIPSSSQRTYSLSSQVPPSSTSSSKHSPLTHTRDLQSLFLSHLPPVERLFSRHFPLMQKSRSLSESQSVYVSQICVGEYQECRNEQETVESFNSVIKAADQQRTKSELFFRTFWFVARFTFLPWTFPAFTRNATIFRPAIESKDADVCRSAIAARQSNITDIDRRRGERRSKSCVRSQSVA